MLFIMPYKVVLTLEFVDENVKCYLVTIQMKAIEQYLFVVLFIVLYKYSIIFWSLYVILKRNHSIESYWAVGPLVFISYAV